MATEHHLCRRAALFALAGATSLKTWATDSTTALLACWDSQGQHHAGIVRPGPAGLNPQATIELPTRGHGVWSPGDGSVWVAARRPGDWLLRWHPATGARSWLWVDDDRRLNGHVQTSPDGRFAWTTETDQDNAQGLIGVRAVDKLRKQAEWATHGVDPHDMLVLPEPVGRIPAGALVVANGGIPTQSETGRSRRNLANMDPSLVALDPGTGALLGQWRLRDPRLSIRHLAWDPASRQVGIALQAEHDDPALRQHASLFASWDRQGMRLGEPMPDSLGYGGDIAPRDGGGFWVSATLANRLLGVDTQGRTVASRPLASAGALTSQGRRLWAGGARAMMEDAQSHPVAPDWQIDNHWMPFGTTPLSQSAA